MKKWSTSETEIHLREKGLTEESVALVRDQKLIGKDLAEFTRNDFVDLGFPLVDAIRIEKIKNAYSLDKSSSNKSKEQNVRSFLDCVGTSLSYEKGNYIKHEIGASSLSEPSREFKQFNVDKDKEIEIYEEPFVDKVGKYLIACLNRRCNGTIYLGVADGQKGKKKDIHGQITGVCVSKNKREIFEDWMDKHFRGNDPTQFQGIGHDKIREDIKAAFEVCVGPVNLIPLVNSDDVVIEIDVDPKAEVCGNIRFFLQPKGGQKKFYVRKGTASSTISEQELMKIQVQYITDRKNQEKALHSNEIKLKDRLRNHFCQGRQNIDDLYYKFILICDRSSCNDDLEWLGTINWMMVIDLDAKSGNDGILKYLKDHGGERILTPPYDFTPQKLEKMREEANNDRDFRRAVHHGLAPIWVSANQMDEPYKQWHKTQKNGIRLLIQSLMCEEAIEDVNNAVIITLVYDEKSIEKISAMIQEFLSHRVELSKCLFLIRDKQISDQLYHKLKDVCDYEDYERQAVCGEYGLDICSIVNTFVKNNIKTFVYDGILVPVSQTVKTGNFVPLPVHVLERFYDSGLEIVGKNQCNKSFKNKDDEIDANKQIVDFFRGCDPSWEVYYLSEPSKHPINWKLLPGLVERKNVSLLVSDLKSLATSKVVDKSKVTKVVIAKRILHEPGSGATTIGKHVLWVLKEEMKCILVDAKQLNDGEFGNEGKMEEFARLICEYREFGEGLPANVGKTSKSSTPPVLIMLDNSNEALAKGLISAIQKEIKRRKVEFDKTLFFILYLERKDAINSQSTATEEWICNEERIFCGDCIVEQSLDSSEEEMFKSRLDALKESLHDSQIFKIENMLSFVIMAENFNDKSQYVQGVVSNILENIDLYPKEKSLLLYLCILKYYANMNLPAKHCGRYVFGLCKGSNEFYQNLCPQAKSFLKQISIKGEDGRGVSSAIEVCHKPVAFQAMRILLESKKLSVAVIEMVCESGFLKERFLKPKMEQNIRKLIGHRIRVEEYVHASRKRQYSELVTDIRKNESDMACYETLIKVYNELEADEEKAFISQTLARLYYNSDCFQDGLNWATMSIAHLPNNYTMFDTRGHVYKTQLRYVKNITDCICSLYSIMF